MRFLGSLMPQKCFGSRALDPAGGAYSAPPDLAGLLGGRVRERRDERRNEM